MGDYNMKWKASKISTLRTWALLLVFVGMGVMVFGTSGILMFGEVGKIIAGIFMVLGIISCFISMGIYFWVGMLSTSAPVIDCPECGKRTKMLGATDRCMYCHTILTVDAEKATEGAEHLTKTGNATDAPLPTQP
jgi:Zinc-ribbon containing domain